MGLGKLLYLLAAAAILMGCGSQTPSSGVESSLSDDASTLPPYSTPVPGKALSSAQLAGSWLSGCSSNSSSQRSGTNLVTFSGSQMTQTITNYPGLYCNGASDFMTQLIGNYTLGGLSSAVPQATVLTGSVTQVTMRAMTALAVSNANAQAYCGFTDWSINVTKTISLGASCLGGVSTAINEVVAISGNQLFFGNSSNTALENTGYTRQ